jgi:hypothetical protein
MPESVGSASVEVVPDASGWAEKLRSQIRDAIVSVKVELDDEEASAKLDMLEARLDAIGIDRPTINVDVDAGEAEAELAALDAEVDEVTRDRSINIKGSWFSQGIGSFISDLGLLPSLAMAAGTALVPLTAVVGGLALALGAPIAIVAGGGTLFAFLAGFAVKGAMAQQKTITTLQTKLAALKKGTKEYAQTQQQLAAAQAKLNPAQKTFLGALDKMKGAFNALPKGALLGPLSAGMLLLAHVMPDLAPVIRTVSHDLMTLLDGLGKSASGGGLKSLINAFDKQLGPDLLIFGKIAANVLRGVGSLFLTTGGQLSKGLLSGLLELSEKFATFGQSSTFQSFLDYVKREAPAAGALIVAIATALGHIIIAAAPIGAVVVRVVTLLATAISDIPLPVLRALLIGLAAIGAASLIESISNPVGAIIAIAMALSYAWKHSETFRDVMKAVFHAVGEYARIMWNYQIRPAFIAMGFAIGVLMKVWAKMLAGLGKLPSWMGFGWAKSASSAMNTAANAAMHLGSYLKAIPASKHATVTSNAPAVLSAVQQLQKGLDALHGSTVTINEVRETSYLSKVVGQEKARAGGGSVMAGLNYLVGEEGPEIVRFGHSGRVYSNAQSQAMINAAQAGRGGRVSAAPAGGSLAGALHGTRMNLVLADGTTFPAYIDARATRVSRAERDYDRSVGI